MNNNIPYIIEPYSAYSYNKKRKKSLQETIEEEEMMYRLISNYLDQLNIQNTVVNTPVVPVVGTLPVVSISLANSIMSAIQKLVVATPNFTNPDSSSYLQYGEIDGLYYDVNGFIPRQFKQNPNLWLKNIDITCIPSNFGTGGGIGYLGCLVAPDIIYTANHVLGFLRTGSNYYAFTDNNNNTYSASIVMTSSLVGGADIGLIKISPPMPSNIKPCKVLPTKVTVGNQYLSVADITSGYLPVIVTDNTRKIKINVLSFLSKDIIGYAYSTVTPYNNWSLTIIPGDSGTPSFFLINGELVLLTTYTYGGPGSGANLSGHINDINAAIANMGSTSSLTQIDVSGFTTYY